MISISDIGKDHPYKDTYFILISKKHIGCLSYIELLDGQEMTPTSKNYLGDREEFSSCKPTIIEFCKFATKYFESV